MESGKIIFSGDIRIADILEAEGYEGIRKAIQQQGSNGASQERKPAMSGNPDWDLHSFAFFPNIDCLHKLVSYLCRLHSMKHRRCPLLFVRLDQEQIQSLVRRPNPYTLRNWDVNVNSFCCSTDNYLYVTWGYDPKGTPFMLMSHFGRATLYLGAACLLMQVHYAAHVEVIMQFLMISA